MTDINVTRLITDSNPFDFSASAAELGENAGPETWANAKAEAAARPLEIDDREGVKEFFAGFGAWDREEIAAWTDLELDALVLQYAAGDLREVQSRCPGEGLGDVDWDEAERMGAEGTISGNLYASGDELFITLSD